MNDVWCLPLNYARGLQRHGVAGSNLNWHSYVQSIIINDNASCLVLYIPRLIFRLKGDSPSRDGYQSYIMNEHRMKPANALLLNALYDRITSDMASRRWQALVDRSDPKLLDELENVLRSFWCSYIDYVVGVV